MSAFWDCWQFYTDAIVAELDVGSYEILAKTLFPSYLQVWQNWEFIIGLKQIKFILAENINFTSLLIKVSNTNSFIIETILPHQVKTQYVQFQFNSLPW